MCVILVTSRHHGGVRPGVHPEIKHNLSSSGSTQLWTRGTVIFDMRILYIDVPDHSDFLNLQRRPTGMRHGTTSGMTFPHR